MQHSGKDYVSQTLFWSVLFKEKWHLFLILVHSCAHPGGLKKSDLQWGHDATVVPSWRWMVHGFAEADRMHSVRALSTNETVKICCGECGETQKSHYLLTNTDWAFLFCNIVQFEWITLLETLLGLLRLSKVIFNHLTMKERLNS